MAGQSWHADPHASGARVHAVVVALHPEGMEAVLGVEGEERLSLTVNNAVLNPHSSKYHLANRGGTPRLLLVVGTHRDANTGQREPVQRIVAVGEDAAGGPSQGAADAAVERPSPVKQPEAPGPDLSGPAGDAVGEKAHVEAALARIMATASDPPPAAAKLGGEGQSQERHRQMEGTGIEEDDGVEIPGAREAQEVEGDETAVADRTGPETGEVETCRHWAKWWCMRVHTCRFPHPQPPVPQGVPQDWLLILGTIARVRALQLNRSDGHEQLLCDVVEAARTGGLPAVGYAVARAGRVVWAVALPCGIAALLTMFLVVPWRDMVSLQEASLGRVCRWHTDTPLAWTRKDGTLGTRLNPRLFPTRTFPMGTIPGGTIALGTPLEQVSQAR